MSSNKFNLAANANKVSAFSKDIEFKESKVPEPSDDFVSKFKETSGPSKDFANQHVINVLPNFVPILAYILYHVNQYIPHLEHTKHAKISAGTFTAYCLSIVYGYILCCDLYVRPTPSMHAALWEDETHRQRFVEFLFTLPVPDFIAPILNKLTPCTSDRRGNILFVPSAAGFKYRHHFGRFFPIIMFTNIHDVAAETASNTAPAQVFVEYLQRSLYKIAAVRNGVTNFNASPAHFLGTFFQSGGQPSSYGSKLEQIFQTVFNPVLFRDYQRRQTLASASLSARTYPTSDMNFYDLIFSASTANLSELRVIFQQIASAMKGNVKCPGDLASFFKSFSGQDILRHGYQLYQLPTWHHTAIQFPTSNYVRPQRVTPDDFSTAIRFLRTPSDRTLVALTQPSGTCETDKKHKVTVTTSTTYNRLRTDNADSPSPTDNEFVSFNEDVHLFPKAYIFTLTGSTIDAWDATAFGMVIETVDIDGSVVPVPNTGLSLGIENSWFADSCIPLDRVFRSIHFDTTATTHHARALHRVTAARQTLFPAASLLVDRTQVVLPRLNANSVATASISHTFPGLTSKTSNWSAFIQRFLGFRTVDNRSHGPTDDAIPGMSRFLLCWSPYTFVGYEGDNDFAPAHDETRIYFVTNLRTIFGTDVPLVQVNNGLDSMPIS
ncbi:coat protein [Trichoderma citrinoviride partitivirus 1]|nr:coat protein [Trichoderma citrinoviride partitivirus 1]